MLPSSSSPSKTNFIFTNKDLSLLNTPSTAQMGIITPLLSSSAPRPNILSFRMIGAGKGFRIRLHQRAEHHNERKSVLLVCLALSQLPYTTGNPLVGMVSAVVIPMAFNFFTIQAALPFPISGLCEGIGYAWYGYRSREFFYMGLVIFVKYTFHMIKSPSLDDPSPQARTYYFALSNVC